MTYFQIKFAVKNKHGMQVGGEVVMKLYAPSRLDTECAAFSRMLLEYGRCVGCGGCAVEIISIES